MDRTSLVTHSCAAVPASIDEREEQGTCRQLGLQRKHMHCCRSHVVEVIEWRKDRGLLLGLFFQAGTEASAWVAAP
jgi:hypothetical protein